MQPVNLGSPHGGHMMATHLEIWVPNGVTEKGCGWPHCAGIVPPLCALNDLLSAVPLMISHCLPLFSLLFQD